MKLVAGCSWAIGEVKPHDSSTKISPQEWHKLIVHDGLSQFFNEAGHETKNLAWPGGSNFNSTYAIRKWILRNPTVKVDCIYVFQTEYTRDQNFLNENDYALIRSPASLANNMITRFYRELSDIAQKNNCRVYLIGGAADTLWIENIHTQYPGLTIACQSFYNLCVNDNPCITDPVLDWYDEKAVELVEIIKSRLTPAQVPEFLDILDHAFQREVIVHSQQHWFGPSGYHPNRNAFFKLYEHLVKNNYV